VNRSMFAQIIHNCGFRPADMDEAWRRFRLYQANNGLVHPGELRHQLLQAKGPGGVVSQGSRRMCHNTTA